MLSEFVKTFDTKGADGLPDKFKDGFTLYLWKDPNEAILNEILEDEIYERMIYAETCAEMLGDEAYFEMLGDE